MKFRANHISKQCLILILLTTGIAATLGCNPKAPPAEPTPAVITVMDDKSVSNHMTAQAALTAHYIDAALKAGTSTREINETLTKIANETIIDEFWISDSRGGIDYTNRPDILFEFPRNANEGTQPDAFTRILTDGADTVTQPPKPRQSDETWFKYLAVRGVDQLRIVQVGIRYE